ncbi:MAG: DUF6293 family protein [Archaeoglobaceae archaeon]
MRVVHLILAGERPSVILDGIKASGYPIHGAYVFYEDEESKKIAENVKKVLSSLIDIETVQIPSGGVYAAVWEILKAARREKDAGAKLVLGVATHSRRLAMAAVVAAQIAGGDLIVFREDGIEKIATPPISMVNEDKMKILRVLESEGGEVDSINRLIELIEGKVSDQKRYMAQRARMSYHLNGLEEDGLVVTERRGKNLRISLTELGKAYVIMFG